MGKWIKRFAGAVAALVGMFGIALSVYATLELWKTADRLSRDLPEAIGQAKSFLASIDRQGSTAAEVVQTARDRLAFVRLTVDELPRSGTPRTTGNSVLDSVSEELMNSLARAEDFIRLMQSNLEGASSALLLLESIPIIGPSLSQHKSDGESDLRLLATSLTEISAALKQATDILEEIRTRRTIDSAQIDRLQHAIGQVDYQLLQLQQGIGSLSQTIHDVSNSLAKTERQIAVRIRRSAQFLTAFLLCFAFSQLHLVVHGLARK